MYTIDGYVAGKFHTPCVLQEQDIALITFYHHPVRNLFGWQIEEGFAIRLHDAM